MSKMFTVKARRPLTSQEVAHLKQHPSTKQEQWYWMDVGIATEVEDGNILITLNALPFQFDGELKLRVKERK